MTNLEARITTATTIDELYELLPEIECRGKCHTTCGKIDMTNIEHKRLVNLGVRIPRSLQAQDIWQDDILDRASRFEYDCPALTFLKTCVVYEHRPLICRLYGLAEDLKCMYGCQPQGGHLSARTSRLILAQAAKIDGNWVAHKRWMLVVNDPNLTEAYNKMFEEILAKDNLNRRLNERTAGGA